MNWEDHSPIEWQAATRQARWYEWLLVLLLLGLAGGVRAAPVYKCTDAGGGVAYQTLPCSAQQSEAVVPIAAAPAYAKSPEYAVERTTEPRARATNARREPQASQRRDQRLVERFAEAHVDPITGVTRPERHRFVPPIAASCMDGRRRVGLSPYALG